MPMFNWDIEKMRIFDPVVEDSADENIGVCFETISKIREDTKFDNFKNQDYKRNMLTILSRPHVITVYHVQT